ncbi:MAG: DNA-processing protein DprA, partial [Nitriliruptorales bacterium]
MREVWEEVAAPGSDPELVERLVARLLGPRGHPVRIVDEAIVLTEEDSRFDPVVDGAQRRTLLERLAPPPGTTERDAARVVAAKWRELEVRVALPGDPAYPVRLATGWPANRAPALLAWRGPESGMPDRPSVAIVGARRATAYGTGIASWLAESASSAGVTVVSGGAVGIDAAAHRAALDGPGRTAVYLGCGHAVGYPRAHARSGGLFDHILAAGGWLLSELPPDVGPRPANVLARNRLVAGAVDVVVVVEGGARSGTLRTAEAAAERGVQVLAVPGDVRAPGSQAPHRLLRDGAAPCTGPDDLLTAV